MDEEKVVHSRTYPTRGLAIAAVVLLLGCVFTNLVDFPLELMYYRVLDRLGQNVHLPAAPDDLSQATDLETILGVVGIAHFIAMLGTVVIFLIWHYRSYANLGLMGIRGLSYSAGWAVGSYFVPILNLFRPYQIMQEVWKGSDPESANQGPYAWRSAAGSMIVRVWWAFWIASNVTAQITFQINMDANASIPTLKTAAAADAVDALLTAAAGSCLAFVIYSVTDRQEKRLQGCASFDTQLDADLERY